MMQRFAHDLRQSSRLLRRTPAFSAVAVATLALGIAASTMVFSVVNAYLIRPLPFREPERLVWVDPFPTRDAFLQGINPPEDLQTLNLEALDVVFSHTAAWDLDGFTLASTERPEYVDGAWVSHGFFQTLGIAPSIGRAFTREETASGAPVAVISHALWQRRFGSDPAAVGRTFTAYSTDRPDESVLFTIIGVLPPDFWYFNRFTDVLVPLRGPRMISLARLRNGVAETQAERRLNIVGREQFPGADARWHMTLRNAHDEHVNEVRPTLMVLLGAVGFVVLVACANVAGLLLARAAGRRREITIRAALGASRARVMRQLLSESLVLATLASALGIGLAIAGLRALGPTIAEQLPATVPGGVEMLRLDGLVLAFTVGVATLTVLGFGFVPAIATSRLDLASALAQEGRSSTPTPARARARAALVTTQIAISLVLLAGAASLIRLTIGYQRMELGFDPSGVVKASVLLPRAEYPEEHQRVAFFDAVRTRLEQMPGIASASMVNSYPFRGAGAQRISAEGTLETNAIAARTVIGQQYLETLRIPLLQGRAFAASDDSGSMPVVLISRTLAARLWPEDAAVGRRVKLGDPESGEPWRTVVGVVGDTRKSYTDSLIADVYLPYRQSPRAYMYLVAHAADGALVSPPALQEAVWSVDRRQPVSETGSLEDVVSTAMASHRFLALLLAGFSAFAVALAALGLYGVLAYLVTSRRREIAVRVACGARSGHLFSMVLRQAAPLVLLGIAAGIAGSVLLARLLASLIAGVQTADVAILIPISVLLALAALAATLLPARRATRLDPVAILRGE